MPIHDMKVLLCDNNDEAEHGAHILVTWVAYTADGPKYGPHGGWFIDHANNRVLCETCTGEGFKGVPPMIEVHYQHGLKERKDLPLKVEE